MEKIGTGNIARISPKPYRQRLNTGTETLRFIRVGHYPNFAKAPLPLIAATIAGRVDTLGSQPARDEPRVGLVAGVLALRYTRSRLVGGL